MLLLKNQNFKCRTEAYVRIETHDDEDDEKGSSRTSCPPDQRYLFCFIPLRTWSVGGTWWWWWWPSGADISAPYGLSWHVIVLLLGRHSRGQRFRRKPPKPPPSAVWSFQQAQPCHPLPPSATRSRRRGGCSVPHPAKVDAVARFPHSAWRLCQSFWANFYNHFLLHEAVSGI